VAPSQPILDGICHILSNVKFVPNFDSLIGQVNRNVMIKNYKKTSKKRKKATQQAAVRTVVKRYGSDSYKYFEENRHTIVEGEPTGGSEGVDHLIFRYCPMKWSDSGKPLATQERKKAFRAVGKYLDEQKIKWKFSNFGVEDWIPPK
jgi:hypothetical protein